MHLLKCLWSILKCLWSEICNHEDESAKYIRGIGECHYITCLWKVYISLKRSENKYFIAGFPTQEFEKNVLDRYYLTNKDSPGAIIVWAKSLDEFENNYFMPERN